MSILSRDRNMSSAVSDFRSRAAQRIAVESFRNIANVEITSTPSSAPLDPDVEAIVLALTQASTPLWIADLADKLDWTSDRVSEALTRGSQQRRLAFNKSGDRTYVGLPAAAP